MDTIPSKALSVMQPWAWLIVNRHKAIENRDWPTRFRGPVAIHAGKKIDSGPARDLRDRAHPVSGGLLYLATPSTYETGGIVGIADIVDCITESDNEWFVGRYGFVLANQRPVPFIPVKGALGFFDWRQNVIIPKQPEPARQGSMF